MLNVGLQEHMEVFEVPFSCDIDNELNVMCTIPGIGKKPAERLSGGQRVMLGIAFRFAICRLFAAGLGFVVLDEPTVMLDDDHVDIVVDLLNAIKGHLFNAGLQLLVPTHSPQLESTFDSVIRV
jgi:exonuclease SbcC